ncbi:hypothetical protein DSO57_1014384 [Entomophthora muscae]|uniref:Uncharacterized protein n=1 Tax=Entomophthora muscae TaxID=34485 RepID=A0ACC2TH62_9FUNG|nr:hypothetical protein DSO57_1014384 [Entomophthora muscae]
MLSLNAQLLRQGSTSFETVLRLKRHGLLAASKIQSLEPCAKYREDGMHLRSTFLNGLVHVASDYNNVITFRKINRIMTSKDPVLFKFSCSTIKLSHGICLPNNSFICSGGKPCFACLFNILASVLGMPAFAVWSIENHSNVQGMTTPSSLGMIQADQPETLMDVSIGSNTNLFYGCTDTARVVRWDSRENHVASTEKSHSGPIVSISLNPFNKNLFATGGVDKQIKIWDIRKLAKSGKSHAICEIDAHDKPIKKIAWSPFCENLIASSSEDASVRIFSSQGERLLVHLGHRSPVETFSWCDWEKSPYTIASADYDSQYGVSTIQVWGFNEIIVESHLPSQSLRL